MKDKIQDSKQITIYTFRRQQIEMGDVRRFLTSFDPFRLPPNRLQDLCGSLVLKFEDIHAGDVPLQPQLRILLRRIHAIWPWSGLFLNLDHPIGCAGPFNNFPLLAVGLCVSDFKLGLWDGTRQALLEVGPQLHEFYQVCHDVVARMGNRIGLPVEVIAAWHQAVESQFKHIFVQ
jgi:hypothetical protein